MSENKQTGKSKIPGIVRCIYQRYKNLNKIYNKNSHFKNLNKSNNLEQRNDYYVNNEIEIFYLFTMMFLKVTKACDPVSNVHFLTFSCVVISDTRH